MVYADARLKPNLSNIEQIPHEVMVCMQFLVLFISLYSVNKIWKTSYPILSLGVLDIF